MRLTGGVFLDGEFRAPWSVISQIGPDDCAIFFPETASLPPPSHVIGYHFVRSGRLTCEVEGQPPHPVRQGEIVLLPRNERHVLHGPVRCTPVDGHELIEPAAEDGLFRIRWPGDGEATSIYCGFLGSTTPDNMLLKSLPSVMVIRLDDAPDSAWIRRSLDFAVHDLGRQSPEMVGKLAEVLFAEAVRRYVQALPPHETGWLAGLQDPAVGRAISIIHKHYADALTLEGLAGAAGVSKTVLGERFRALLGESPMHYCAKWRMQIAAGMLRHNRQNACSVAYSVGFNSEAAFNRAFRREFGMPPAAWQKEVSGNNTGD